MNKQSYKNLIIELLNSDDLESYLSQCKPDKRILLSQLLECDGWQDIQDRLDPTKKERILNMLKQTQ